jgi:hypothetical protein
MIRPALLIAIIITLAGGVTPNVRAEITAQQARKAINKGVSHLKNKQRGNGTWPDFAARQEGGITALCTLALLNAGVEPEDKQLKKALDWLRDHRLKSTYAVGLQTMVFCRAGPSKYRLLIDRNVKWLEKNQNTTGPRTGAWGYPGQTGGDNSNSQFALLALHEAQRMGVGVRPQTWRMAKEYWEGCQNSDGSWGYWKGRHGTGSMTCAGIASLIIVNDKVYQTDAKVVGERVHCCSRGELEDDQLRSAVAWLARNFRVTGNPGPYPKQWGLYYLYGLERVGRLTAQRFIGKHDWYREGADYLVNDEIAGANHWQGIGHAENNDLIATSLALLFLSKGRRPVLIAKLRHPPGDDWDQHRADVANLTKYVESQWRLDMTWQVINLSAASIDDLAQSPVLFYSGKNTPLPRGRTQIDRLAEKIRGYLDRGGFLLAEANCGGPGFDEGFRALMKKVFPEPEYRLRLLPPEHPIWRAEKPVDPQYVRPLLGIDFGCRTSVVYAPPCKASDGDTRPSLSCLWELSGGRDVEKYPPTVQDRIKAAEAIGINILTYATNRELKPKDAIPRLATKAQADALAGRGRVAIANLRHPGGCNVAPRALVNLLEAASAELKLRTSPESHTISMTDEALFNYHMAFMHGRTTFRLTEDERKRLGEFIERGGLLLANSICGSRPFSESFRREMEAVFPNKRLQRIPATDPLLTTAYGGFNLAVVTRRDPQSAGGDGPMKAALRKVPPTLEGIRFGDRWGVIFSPYDLSCALEKHNSLECHGYIRKDAARIGLNVLLYSLQQ